MAANLAATFAGNFGTFESRRSPRASELWNVTPSSNASDGDTGTITTKMKKPQVVIGPYAYTISGQVVTLTAYFAQTTSETTGIEIVGFPF